MVVTVLYERKTDPKNFDVDKEQTSGIAGTVRVVVAAVSIILFDIWTRLPSPLFAPACPYGRLLESPLLHQAL
jgi:hypothetical protein